MRHDRRDEPMDLTITEHWNGAKSVQWTARSGRRVVARAVCPMEYGMVDSDQLRVAISVALDVPLGAVRFIRKRSDGHRVVPRLATVVDDRL